MMAHLTSVELAKSGCKEDKDGVIHSFIEQLKKNPHIRTDALENDLLRLVRKLGIEINSGKVDHVETIWKEYPAASHDGIFRLLSMHNFYRIIS